MQRQLSSHYQSIPTPAFRSIYWVLRARLEGETQGGGEALTQRSKEEGLGYCLGEERKGEQRQGVSTKVQGFGHGCCRESQGRDSKANLPLGGGNKRGFKATVHRVG